MKDNQATKYPIRLYDDRNDILYIYLDSQYNSFADEEKPNIYVSRSDDDDRIVGFKILDYKKNASVFRTNYPQYSRTL